MRIITWNANSQTRWDQLWADPLVAGLQWDVICLQEVGNPVVNQWHQLGGVPWLQAEQRQTNEMTVRRTYSYQPPTYPNPLFIEHMEWPNSQKNHLVMITRSRASWCSVVSGEMGQRPVMAIKAQVSFPAPAVIAPRGILLSCAHVVANATKAPQEINAIESYVTVMCRVQGLDDWIVAGDLNCPPDKALKNLNTTIAAWYPGVATHSGGQVLDYIVTSGSLYDAVEGLPGNGGWQLGTARSDHQLVEYTRNGVTLEIL